MANTTSTTACNVANCKSCSSTVGKCSVCHDGYFKTTANVCSSCVANCKTCTANNNCQVCQSGYTGGSNQGGAGKTTSGSPMIRLAGPVTLAVGMFAMVFQATEM
jgi:hypothetical protein